jgi:hypothetical protein
MGEKDTLLTDFDHKRTLMRVEDPSKIADLSRPMFTKNLVGLIVYIIVFVIGIPHLLLKNKHYLLATLYFSNLDMVATVLGFSGGPHDIWKYLYNPDATTLFGWSSSTIINYLALIGVGFVCIDYAIKNTNMFGGLAMFLIILPITYLLPGNLIVYTMNNFASHLYHHRVSYYLRWGLSLLIGFITVVSIIGMERLITLWLSPHLIKTLQGLSKMYR